MGTKERALALHLEYPKEYVSFSRGFDPSVPHYGVDMAWNQKYGGKYPPVFAPADGTVVTSAWHNSYGYYVMIEHASGIRTLMAHMKEMPIVTVGQKVVRGQRVGTQGSTGNSDGPHVHFEVRLDGVKVNPVDYVYVYPEQIVNEYTDKHYGLMHYEPIKYYGHPVERNSKVDQFKIDTDTLRARAEPNLKGKFLGYVNRGIYNVGESVRADGYIWYKIEDFWCAYDKAWAEYLPKTEPHYDLLMKKLNEAQAKSMEAWCKAEGVEYTLTEV
jgi:hypothetical protein